MSRTPCAPVVVGVDVGGPKKGFHAVALRNRQILETCATRDAAAVLAWCRRLDASVVGIDAPCCWSRTGRARPCERALAADGLHAFATPSRTVGERHRFYRWMCKGAELFRLLTPHYRLFDGQQSESHPVCFETFPHAVACALAKTILPAQNKRTDRPRLLREAGLSIDSLTNIDLVDAALCALAADHLLAGTFNTYGDATEGFIIVPLPTYFNPSFSLITSKKSRAISRWPASLG
jgi:predicted nuclease with RNAse H fold